MFFFALFVAAASECSRNCSRMYYLETETCTCIRCGTGNCAGGEWYMPQACEVEESIDSGCRTCGEEHCTVDETYTKVFCTATSSGCVRSGRTCQYSCGGKYERYPGDPDLCYCDHICPDLGDCCSDFNDFCIWNHNCPSVTPMTQSEIDDGGCPTLNILSTVYKINHTQCSDSTLEVGDWCESDGECGLSNDLDNCFVSRYPLDIYVTRAKAISSCVDDGTITCPSGEYVDTERYCDGPECTPLDTQCCNVPGLCLNASYLSCPFHQYWKADNGVTCSTKRCQVDECCEDKASCAEAEGLVTCPSDKFLDVTMYCAVDVCSNSDDDECCTDREYCNNTALNCSDEENYFLNPDVPDQCAERCTEAECCFERASCANNTVLICNSTNFLDPKKKCATDECLITDSQCCQPKVNCDQTVICPITMFSDPKQLCATDVCEQSDTTVCCQPKANCVDNGEIHCDQDFFIDTKLLCATDICSSSDTQCCAPRSSCDDTISCSKNEFSDPKILCATDICKASDTQCCQPKILCNNETNCGADFYFNTSKYCSTDTCTSVDSHCCEPCIETSTIYPLEGVCPGAAAPKDGSAHMCREYDSNTQHRFEIAIANKLWSKCNSWCIYDLYDNGDTAFIWRRNKGENGCYIETTKSTCFEADDRDKVLEKMRLLCPPEPFDACKPLDSQNDCQIVWNVDPVENPVAFNRLIYCHCPNPLYWGFRDWSASAAVLCDDEGHGLETRLYLALANRAWSNCVNWCIYDVWQPGTYAWFWDRHKKCYHQRYNDDGSQTVCSTIWHQANTPEYNDVKNYTDGFCTEKDVEWILGERDQSCAKGCGQISRSCDGDITFTVNNDLSELEAVQYFSKAGVNCSDILMGDHGMGGGPGYYPHSGNCILASSIDGYSFRAHCEVSPISTFQRLCACVTSPKTPSPY